MKINARRALPICTVLKDQSHENGVKTLKKKHRTSPEIQFKKLKKNSNVLFLTSPSIEHCLPEHKNHLKKLRN